MGFGEIMPTTNIAVPREQIEAFCAKWGIKEFSLFGSILREDYSPDSDVDVLITFQPGRQMTFESFIEMREALSEIFSGREIDLTEKRLVKNPFRRHEILTTREIIYAA
jgi:predicted nucleotidyltransferase